MNTITIERSLLEQVLDAIQELEHASTAVADKKARDAKSNLRAALPAPATAPEQPSWHDAPDGLDLLHKDARRYQWLAEYLVSNDESYDDQIVSSQTVEEISCVIDTAMKGNTMTSDKELLELAANAARVKTGKHRAIKDGLLMENDLYWNPLRDDGDALRLAVKLRIAVDYYERLHKTECVCAAWIYGATGGAEHEDLGGDPYAATRRAIVRAAAEIGKAMP